MKIITLAVAAPVNGPLRQPSEGALTVTDDEAQRLHDAGVLTGEPEDLSEGDEPDDDGLDGENVQELGRIVTKEGVALNGVTKKADIIAAIRAHRAGPVE